LCRSHAGFFTRTAMSSLMHGFPPAPDGQVTLANWRTAPFNRWAFHHVRELVPSAEIAPAATGEVPWPRALRELPVGDPAATDTDGLVIVHRGVVVHEFYANGLTAQTQHILMSVSKSLLGLLAGALVGRGQLDPESPVTDLIPEVAGTAYRDATIRHLLDMRVGVAFDENYLATSGPIIEYRKSTGWNPLAPGETPSDLRSFYRHLTAGDDPHGGRFHYVSPNTDLLGWVFERASGVRYADLVSELLWRPMGAEHAAYITVDRLGAPRCAGGMCVTARDLARVGQLVVEGGRHQGREVVPKTWIDDIFTAGDPEAWKRGPFVPYFPGLPIHYRSKCYVVRGPQPLLFGFGIHGQHLFVDPTAEIVIAKVSSQAAPLDAPRIARTLEMVQRVREALGAAGK
jgi:CubicO group peptidase (beta-lactamase class C family)